MNQGIRLNGTFYRSTQLDDFIHTAISKEDKIFYKEVVGFLQEWFDKSDVVWVHTSGSTGTPKQLQVKKEHMRNSARATCDFMKLKADDEILLCMPVKYIAGKMMLVRAAVANLSVWVVTPSGRPLKSFSKVVDFAAMVPLQIFNTLQVESEKIRLQRIKHLLIGGGSIDEAMATELLQFPHGVYSSYGMTETVSHIAIRELSGVEASEWYYPFPSVKLSQTDQGALIIDAPLVSDSQLITNDVIEFNSDGGFRILGRLDNIINTGGVKIQAEKVEQKIENLIDCPYVVTSRRDAKLGEAVTLLIESNLCDVSQLKEALKERLTSYELPKDIFLVETLPLTDTQKIKRVDCKQLADQLYQQHKTI